MEDPNSKKDKLDKRNNHIKNLNSYLISNKPENLKTEAERELVINSIKSISKSDNTFKYNINQCTNLKEGKIYINKITVFPPLNSFNKEEQKTQIPLKFNSTKNFLEELIKEKVKKSKEKIKKFINEKENKDEENIIINKKNKKNKSKNKDISNNNKNNILNKSLKYFANQNKKENTSLSLINKISSSFSLLKKKVESFTSSNIEKSKIKYKKLPKTIYLYDNFLSEMNNAVAQDINLKILLLKTSDSLQKSTFSPNYECPYKYNKKKKNIFGVKNKKFRRNCNFNDKSMHLSIFKTEEPFFLAKEKYFLNKTRNQINREKLVIQSPELIEKESKMNLRIPYTIRAYDKNWVNIFHSRKIWDKKYSKTYSTRRINVIDIINNKLKYERKEYKNEKIPIYIYAKNEFKKFKKKDNYNKELKL